MIDVVVHRAEHAAAATALIVGIQREEFDFDLTAPDQPDLGDVDRFYRESGGEFWVALDDGRVVGTIGLLGLGTGRGALRRMFVAADRRGPAFGVARGLLDASSRFCTLHGIDSIYLGTTERFVAARRFYEKNGFVRIDPAELPPAFPRIAADSRFYRRGPPTGAVRPAGSVAPG